MMSSNNNRSDFFNKVIRSLDSIADPNQLNQLSRIELDLILEKLRTLYDQVYGIPKVIKKPEKEVELELEIQHDNEMNPSRVDEEIQQSETESTEIEFEELISGKMEKKDKQDKETSDPDLFSEPDNQKKNPESKSVVDVISEEFPNESVAEKIYKHSKVESLKNTIGINEKFFFINELFDGNLSEYNDAIDSLDKLKIWDDSVSILEDLSQKYNWQGKTDAVEQLKQFVARKLK